jgi:hypothetical protein
MSLERVEKFVYSWCKSSECRRRKRRSMRESENRKEREYEKKPIFSMIFYGFSAGGKTVPPPLF